jgi:hypothetical protein
MRAAGGRRTSALHRMRSGTGCRGTFLPVVWHTRGRRPGDRAASASARLAAGGAGRLERVASGGLSPGSGVWRLPGRATARWLSGWASVGWIPRRAPGARLSRWAPVGWVSGRAARARLSGWAPVGWVSGRATPSGWASVGRKSCSPGSAARTRISDCPGGTPTPGRSAATCPGVARAASIASGRDTEARKTRL